MLQKQQRFKHLCILSPGSMNTPKLQEKKVHHLESMKGLAIWYINNALSFGCFYKWRVLALTEALQKRSGQQNIRTLGTMKYKNCFLTMDPCFAQREILKYS